MTLRVLHALERTGDVGLELDIDEDSTPARIRELYAPPRETWLRLNLIAAVSGDAAGSDGTSETLSNATDRTILAAIRSLADGEVTTSNQASVTRRAAVAPAAMPTQGERRSTAYDVAARPANRKQSKPAHARS